MADRRPDPESTAETGAAHDERARPGTPRWVKMLGVIAIVVVVLVVVVMFLVGGEHGPSRHAPGAGGQRPTGVVAAMLVLPPCTARSR